MGGMGIGFHGDKAIFVANTIIGDVVDATIYLSKKDHAFAKVHTFHSRGVDIPSHPARHLQRKSPAEDAIG